MKELYEAVKGKRLVVAAHQPHFLPWNKYMGKIILSDVFIFLDDYQFERGVWIEKNKVRDKKNILEVGLKIRNKEKIEPINNKLVIGSDIDKLFKLGYKFDSYLNVLLNVLKVEADKGEDTLDILNEYFIENIFFLKSFFYSSSCKCSDKKKIERLVCVMLCILENSKIDDLLFNKYFENLYGCLDRTGIFLEVQKMLKKAGNFEEKIKILKENVLFVNSSFGTYEYMIKDENFKLMPPILIYDFENIQYKQKNYKQFIGGLSCIDYFGQGYDVYSYYNYLIKGIRFKEILHP